MKRSNLLFTLLLAVLFLGPLFMWLFYTCANKKSYTRIPGIYPVVWIENPKLTADNVEISTGTSAKIPYADQDNPCYLYYKGDKQYLPEISTSRDTLRIGKALDAKSHENGLKLKFHLECLESVYLNGQQIWTKKEQ
ncbi:hypothetical protein H8788_00280 [Parabacteroides faecis]|uniref:hypothetical protein n=1 Tax=Parabacteroides TaxID=375288 RepID=UPI000EFE3D6F|nr:MULTISPECIES: hypothetical protein [Parabacteroides]MBC8616169.1 hypothetical protein [Parabacteroides faecis]MCS2891743.1 hypothetical protein [Parabacteroides faecis]RHR98454.1 hypothetical protein DWW23_11445 [Parabacteroides sp. AF14-59]UVQ44643.1 hypothetical protein NXY11_15715 [Parabacteroides faecis]